MTDPLQILVVDDEEGMRLGVIRALSQYVARFADLAEEAHYEVSAAGTGEEACASIARHAPHILLLDYKLPDMTGLDVLARFTHLEPPILTVMITAYASLHTAIEATKSGAFDFLPKPFTPEELRASVRKATRNLIMQRRARSLEQERQRARFELISVVAHELKAPLAAIEGYLRILEDPTTGEDPATRSRVLHRSLVRLDGMRKLIFDLLDLTRIESGQRERKLQTIDLCEVIARAVETVTPVAAERRIQIRVAAPPTLAMTADPSEIEVVLNNLLSNAVKYNRDEGAVTVTLEEGAEQVRIVVADTGIGMSAEERAKLFGEFVRIRNQKTHKILGSGLGLSILKRVAALYGGEVTVESEPDVGSTFAVTLAKTAGPEPTRSEETK
jgi:two-component system, sensor histidine kinase and response regulator